jgi:hypothetical protein
MALSGDTVDVPILPPSQQTPITSAAVGELRMATNAVAKRYAHDKGSALKISKRNGVHLLTAEVRDPNGINAPVLPSGGLTPMANPRLMASLGDRQLVVTASENPFVLAQNVPTWERFDYELPTQALRQRIVFTDNNQMTIPDGAAVGDVYCYVWSRLEAGAAGQPFVAFYDADGTPIRLPFAFGLVGGRIKVVADATQFWVFVEAGGGVQVTVFDVSGANLASAPVAYDIRRPWDITYTAEQGVNFLGTDGTNAVLTHISVAALVIGQTARTFATTKASIAAQFCANKTGDGFLYIATVDYVSYSDEVFGGVIQEGVFAYKLPAAGTVPSTSWLGPVVDGVQTGIAGTGFNAPEQNIVNISGWARGGGALELFIGIANTSDPALNYTKPVRCLADATRLGRPIKRGVSVGSRAFGLGTLGVSVLYYASVQGTLIDGKATVGQPTFFFAEMTSGHDQVCGRFDYGQAAMDYTALGVAFPAVGNGFIAQGTYLFHLPSPFLGADGGVHLPLCYRAESGFQTQALGILKGSTGPSYIARVVSTVGLKDTRVGPRHGRAVDYAGEMFLPGPIATSFTGSSFSEAGVNLAPEMPTVTVDVGGPGFLGTGTYSIAVVFEWTTPNGDRAKSQPSAFVQATTTADGRRLIIVGKSLGMTSRKDVMISIYRTYKTLDSSGNSVMSTIHAKVTNDLRPLFNDPNSDTWTFTDTMSDVACSVNEPLYSDEGELFHDPAPAFSCGCVADNRVMLAGYDNYVWFSAEKTPGASFWFNADAWRIPLPTDDFVVALEPMDNRVLIICERSLWFIPLQQFPDATGQGGSVPAPQRLPFTNGGTGFACQTRDGVMYSSSAKDVWTIARDLSNVRSGAPVIELTDGRAVMGMSTDIDQRLSVPLDNGKILNWDVVAQVWLAHEAPTKPVLSMTFQGRLTYMDVAGFCWRQDDTSFYDGPLYGSDVKIPIITTVDILPVHLGGVKNLKRIWDVFAYGEYRGDHDLHLRVTYDDESDLTTVVPYDFTPDPGLPYLYSFRPKVEQCSAMAFKFFDSFPRGGEPGDSFALELLSFYVGLEKGLVRRPKAIRIPSGVPTYFIPGAQNDGLAQVIVVQSTADLGAFALAPAKTYLSGHTVGIVADTGAMYFLASTTFAPDGVNIIDSSDGRQWLTSGTATTFSPNGQAQVATVQSLAELATFILLPAACFVSGHVVAVVEDSGRMYYLADTGTPDGSNIVTASDGRQWIGI